MNQRASCLRLINNIGFRSPNYNWPHKITDNTQTQLGSCRLLTMFWSYFWYCLNNDSIPEQKGLCSKQTNFLSGKCANFLINVSEIYWKINSWASFHKCSWQEKLEPCSLLLLRMFFFHYYHNILQVISFRTIHLEVMSLANKSRDWQSCINVA